MKSLWEYLAEKIANSSSMLLEMALERKLAINLLRNLQFTIEEHFLKYFGIDSPENRPHWLNELNGYFRKIDRIRLRPNNKKLNSATYTTILWDEFLGGDISDISKPLNSLLRDEYKSYPRTSLTDYEIYEILEKIYHDICYDLASDKFMGVRYYINKYAPKEFHV